MALCGYTQCVYMCISLLATGNGLILSMDKGLVPIMDLARCLLSDVCGAELALLPCVPVQDPESFAKGKALFQSGLLSEAVMALEAEVQRNPQNVDAWRLLGTVHAENDDDQQVVDFPGRT